MMTQEQKHLIWMMVKAETEAEACRMFPDNRLQDRVEWSARRTMERYHAMVTPPVDFVSLCRRVEALEHAVHELNPGLRILPDLPSRTMG